MTGLWNCIARDCKLFFKDKGMFFSAMVTPLILLVLYGTFLANIYKDSFMSAMPEGFSLPEKLMDAVVGGQMTTSLLATSCVTVAFCCNLMMVQDKVDGVRKDFLISPVKRPVLALGYYFATLFATMIVCTAAGTACLIYLKVKGWYLSVEDILALFASVFLLTLFGTALSSVIHSFLSTQGQMSAVGTIVSAGYGFICGAYMPIASFSKGLQRVLSYLPGTYGTSLIKNAVLRGALEEMKAKGVPEMAITGIRDGIDCNIYFRDQVVSVDRMYLIVAGADLVLILIYLTLTFRKRK